MADMRKALGLCESKGLRIWLLVTTLIGLAANVIVLVSCATPGTQSLYLYRVDRSRLAAALSNLSDKGVWALNDTSLPDHWYWGMSGVCAIWQPDEQSTEGNVTCRQKFPPIFSITDMVEIALQSREGEAGRVNNTASMVAVWEEAYGELPEDARQDEEAAFVDLIKACGALAILSAVVAFGLLAVSGAALGEGWAKRPSLWLLYVVSVLDGAMMFGSAVLAVLAMNKGPRWALEAADVRAELVSDFVGPGLYVFFAGALIKLGVVAMAVAAVVIVNLAASLRAKPPADEEKVEEKAEGAEAPAEAAS
ncbi:hypothetical protein F5X68DRAFT_277176 [Plectosphaerella plurivora]|uniref:Uncharacterized protein n=1 Tax=Plectosphaerella plurivora TaxID=936078 RepID=A0A9P8V8W9_9PEZI|nr:hypothetical protein F5X68DRAFT_277176 [Plectosphaerella plurivora]